MQTLKLAWQERQSDSPLIESVWTSSAPIAISRTVIADPCITLSLIKDRNGTRIAVMGPKTKPYHEKLSPGYNCTSIRLKPGVFLKDAPTQKLTDSSLVLPADSQSRFWIGGTRLQFFGFDNAEQFVSQLYDMGHLKYETPGDGSDHQSLRTYSRRVYRLTGLSPYQLYQLRRAHQALRLLKQGVSAVEVVSELGFTDQSHLIRASRHFFGHTPKQLFSLPQTP